MTGQNHNLSSVQVSEAHVAPPDRWPLTRWASYLLPELSLRRARLLDIGQKKNNSI